MDLSKIRMVVTDMDGTLLNSNHEVSSRFFELFEKLKENKIIFVAASGRQYNSIIDKLKPIKQDIIVIAENGGFAMKNGSEIVSTPLSNSKKNEVLKVLEDVPNVHPVLCSKDNAYVLQNSPLFLDKLKEYYTEFDILSDLKGFEKEILKIAVYHFESSEKYIYPAVKHFENDLKVKISGQNWVDVSSPNANKGYALQKVMNDHDIASDEIMVFGDYNNDLEMLALSDYSFAMANAHPNVKKAAKYTTKSNDDFGVEHILEKLLNKL
ncbi:HAD family hydrolase [Costertonia aggregata]|uniref:HAD family phosphatase n=1 Tax=Costertonia aggregata TaxID=343403 RepID=A0A7H9AL61_9FLAO|nr:HAD family hydrolase [Costertonia aggregata]QLG44147.1 HAD family phosphatase [Costertonia aggregata]